MHPTFVRFVCQRLPNALDSRESNSRFCRSQSPSQPCRRAPPPHRRWFERGFPLSQLFLLILVTDPIPSLSWISTFLSVEFLEQLCGALNLERTFQERHRSHHGDALTHPVDFGLICSSPEFEVLNLNTCAILARLVGCQISNTCTTAHRTCCNRSSSPR